MRAKVLSQAAGSSYAEFEGTKVMAGVYGPRQSERRQAFSNKGTLNCEVKLTTFAAQRLGGAGAQATVERHMSGVIEKALSPVVLLDRFPKAVVDVYVEVMEAGGSELAAAVTTACLALADAGIEMTDLVAAAALSRHEGVLALDPDLQEQAAEEAGALIACAPSIPEVTQMSLTGCWSASQVREVLELGAGACGQMGHIMRQALVDAAAEAAQAATAGLPPAASA